MKRRAGAIPLLSLIARAPMRYLQTACGAPQHPGGARWFP